MARDETDREDLLREATALVERIEFIAEDVPSDGEPIIIGFRADGALSIFFGSEPVYQFNAAGHLRRAYCDGLLYKAVRGWLVSLDRNRTPDEVQLLRRELSPDDERTFVGEMRVRLRELAALLDAGSFRVLGQVPTGANVLGRVRSWLAEHDGSPIADSPRV